LSRGRETDETAPRVSANAPPEARVREISRRVTSNAATFRNARAAARPSTGDGRGERWEGSREKATTAKCKARAHRPYSAAALVWFTSTIKRINRARVPVAARRIKSIRDLS